MKGALKKIGFPLAIICALALQTVGMDLFKPAGDPGFGLVTAEKTAPDTILYEYLFGNLPEILEEDTVGLLFPLFDTVPQLTARDTLFPPDSLRESDPFRYKYYVALLDSLTHKLVVDSLRNSGDSLDWPRLDSLYYADSASRAKAAFDAWYAGLSKTERKKYDFEEKANRKQAVTDSILAVKDSLGAIRDSIREATPRILETFALTDSMQYKRIITWTHEREFHRMEVKELDTNYNYRFYDYPFFRKDVNATWLGVAGSALQYYNFFNRKSENGISFYDPYESWSYSPATLPMYNSKTAYTELAFFGTLFAKSQKESNNLHILTTQNFWPAFNLTLEYNRFGGNGMVENEATSNKTFVASTNYLGKRYLMHFGYIYNMVRRGENGGIADNAMVRDTTLDAREYPIYLSNASTGLKKNTFFLDQQYRIPFSFLKNLRNRKVIKAEQAYRDSVTATGDSAAIARMELLLAGRERLREEEDSLGDRDITTAFIGHSSEYSVFRKGYRDQISSSDIAAREFYRNTFLYHPTNSSDSVRVMKLENRLFLRLQPWSSQGIVSKLNGGIGNRILRYYSFDPTFLKGGSNTVWNSAFVYAGVEGQLKDYIHWNAVSDYTFVGDEQNDVSLEANARFDLHPFRRDRKRPVSLNLHFGTSLEEPDFYHQRFFSNHYKWENDFDKISTTELQGELAIPHWNIGLSAGYALLSKNIYFDSTGVVRQNDAPMSVLSATLTKNFNLFRLIHLDHRFLFQLSSDQEVVPLPRLAVNARYYLQFDVKREIMQMQIGANAWYNTSYYTPGWNPAVGAFYNQREVTYNSGPVIDVFLNMQWKRACIFVKVENIGQGWPMDKNDYFSAHHFIRTQRSLKFGIYWPFYKQPTENRTVEAGSGLSGGGRGSGGMGGFINR